MSPYEKYYCQLEINLKDRYPINSEPKFKKQKPKEAAKKHAVAEQWRRWRINGHLKKLGELLHPNMTSKTVKASILTETVRQVKELKKRAAQAGLHQDKDGWFNGSSAMSPLPTFPGECDEAMVCSYNDDKGNTVKGTICCEDRPGLNRDLKEAILSAGAELIKADMAMVGGRTVVEVVVRWPEGGGGEDEVRSLRRAFKALVDNRGLGCNELGQLLGFNGHVGLGLERPTNNRVIGGGYLGRSNWEWENLLSYE